MWDGPSSWRLRANARITPHWPTWQMWRTHSCVQRRHSCRRRLAQGAEASSADSTRHAGVRAPRGARRERVWPRRGRASGRRIAPAPGDRGTAGRAVPRPVQLVRDYAVAAALDQEAPALGASGVLEVAHLARQVAGIDVTQACLAADVGGADEGRGRCCGRPLPLVRRVECAHVPGDVAGDPGGVAGDALEFLIRVVDAGHEQGHHFEPEAHFVDAAQAIENGLHPAAQLAVMAVVPTLRSEERRVGKEWRSRWSPYD